MGNRLVKWASLELTLRYEDQLFQVRAVPLYGHMTENCTKKKTDNRSKSSRVSHTWDTSTLHFGSIILVPGNFQQGTRFKQRPIDWTMRLRQRLQVFTYINTIHCCTDYWMRKIVFLIVRIFRDDQTHLFFNKIKWQATNLIKVRRPLPQFFFGG